MQGYLSDFRSVAVYVLSRLGSIFTNLYENPRFSFLFNMALLPIVLLAVFDIVFSFVLSVKLKRLVLFNIVSPRSWSFLKSSNNYRLKADIGQFRYTAPTRLGSRIYRKLKNHRNNDLKGKVYHKDYVDWKNSMSKNLVLNNMLLRTLINLINKKDKDKK